jgi:iron complex outermembrane receptor protein
MKIKYFLAVSFLLPIISYAQNIFEGVILDKATKEPVPYASIFLMNGKVRANADENGYFKLAVVNNEANDSLIITSIGYVPFKCAISSSNILSSGITKIELTHLVYD